MHLMPTASLELTGRMAFVMKYRKYILAGVVLAATATHAFAVGTADADITAGADNAVATWTAIKALMVPIGVFMIAYGFLKRLKRA